jgi:hypothetical protein
MRSLLLAITALGSTAFIAAQPGPALAKPFPFGGSTRTGLLAHGEREYNDTVTDPEHSMVTLRGVSRVYLVEDYSKTTWSEHKYVRLDLRGKTLRYTVQISGVQCDCAGCLYLSLMKDPSDDTGDNYCGIQTPKAGLDGGDCTEIDVMEANTKAFQTTLHTVHPKQDGKAQDGTCNDGGCTVNWGNNSKSASGIDTSHLYGLQPPGLIDTSKAFNVSASFDESGIMSTRLSQGEVILDQYNRSSASNPNANAEFFPTPSGIPDDAVRRTNESFAMGMVLVLSQWGGFTKLQNWLNGQCNAPYTPCGWPPNDQVTKIWNLEVVPNERVASIVV